MNHHHHAMNPSPRTLRLTVDAAAAFICALGAAFALADLRSPARPAVVLAALVLGVGWAATGWLGIADAAYAGTVALATGVAIPMLVGLLFVELHWWHPVGTAGVLLALAALVSVATFVLDRRREPLDPSAGDAPADASSSDRGGDQA
jgi:hypothetical protein